MKAAHCRFRFTERLLCSQSRKRVLRRHDARDDQTGRESSVRRSTRLFTTVSLLGLMAAPVCAFAQANQAPGRPASQATATQVGEIVVTAERRAEEVQQVPIAITALEGGALDSEGVVGFPDLSQRVPSLRFGA